ncbi:hypothetical protein A1Q2_06471 [Trichosporon asahii var. asahii CBS 8904]|uniref:tRNA-splicing endonuclease subunit Sen15 domain-containing protein n=1 Tax=Trichosporon asahii var. asahii (strain CBS 8904) TaxID=1220162 RepID=K1VJC4_TRIAC|nr:hypothetical protein A1Q2_06471 [Trichosporon asahii var. asahii CBS 8904]
MIAPQVLAPHIAHLTAASPLQAGPLSTALCDLSLAVQWCELHPLQLPGTQWVAVVGRKRKDDPLRAVLPLPLHTTALTPKELRTIFASLLEITVDSLPEALPPLAPSMADLRIQLADKTGEKQKVDEEPESSEVNDTFDPDTLYVAINDPDSTVVYYKLSRGIRKPHDIPDE